MASVVQKAEAGGITDWMRKESISYSGALLAADGSVGSEITPSLGSCACRCSAPSRVWKHSSLPVGHKIRIFNAGVASQLMYGLHTAWLKKAELGKLDAFQATCLRMILGIPHFFYRRVPNTNVLSRAKTEKFSAVLLYRQLTLLHRIANALTTSTSSASCTTKHARVRPNRSKTKAWNAAGEEPRGIRDLQPEGGDPVWVGDWGLPQDQQDLGALGTRLGTNAFVHIKHVAQDRLLERIPHVEDLQASWLFLRYCAAPRANYLLRVLPPALSGVRCRSRRNCRSKLGPASRLCGHPAAGRRRECSTARSAVWRSRPALCEGRPACGTLGILVRCWPGWASTPCTARQRARRSLAWMAAARGLCLR